MKKPTPSGSTKKQRSEAGENVARDVMWKSALRRYDGDGQRFNGIRQSVRLKRFVFGNWKKVDEFSTWREWNSSIECRWPLKVCRAPSGNGEEGRKIPVLFAKEKLESVAKGTDSVMRTI
jgi:hypothetical protein